MLFLIMLAGAALSGVIASHKRRNVLGWSVLGALFPAISLIVVLCMAPLPERSLADPM